jgi:hypothetical protein
MAFGGVFSAKMWVTDGVTHERHSLGTLAVFTSYGSLRRFIQEEFQLSDIRGIYDPTGKLRKDDEEFDCPIFVLVSAEHYDAENSDGLRRFDLAYPYS